MIARIALAAAIFLAPAQAAPKVDDAKVEAAVKTGVQYLRTRAEKQPANVQPMRELILLALLHSGVKTGDPLFDRLLKSVLDEDLATTYRVSLQAMMLEALDRAAHRKRIFKCAQFLVDNQGRDGQWSYGQPTAYPEPAPDPDDPSKWVVQKQRAGRDGGDNSNSQFAALGLRACHDAGILLPKEVIQDAVRAWKEGQEEAAAAGAPRGWNYGPRGNRSYGSMTAGAVGSLVILDHLQGADWRKDDAVNAGIAWLRDAFTVSENPGRNHQHHFYYLYALERAGALYGTETLGKREWYTEGAAWLLANQGADGAWKKTPVDTCFALLFLRRATRPLRNVRDLDRK